MFFTALFCFCAGYGKKDIQNIGYDDDVSPYGSGNQPANTGASASRPSAARWQNWAARKTPVKASVLDIERLSNGRLVVGVPERPDQPLVFPLRGGFPKVSPASPFQGSENPPLSDWQQKPADGVSSKPQFNTSSDTTGVHSKPLIYEEIFIYPAHASEMPQSQAGPPQAAEGSSQVSQSFPALPLKQAAPGGTRPLQPSRHISSRQTGYQPPRDGVSWQQKPVNANWAPKRQRADALQPAAPPTYIIQSSNGYQRFSKTYRKLMYSPEFAAPQSQGSPARQPAGPPHFKGPQRYSHSKMNDRD